MLFGRQSLETSSPWAYSRRGSPRVTPSRVLSFPLGHQAQGLDSRCRALLRHQPDPRLERYPSSHGISCITELHLMQDTLQNPRTQRAPEDVDTRISLCGTCGHPGVVCPSQTVPALSRHCAPKLWGGPSQGNVGLFLRRVWLSGGRALLPSCGMQSSLAPEHCCTDKTLSHTDIMKWPVRLHQPGTQRLWQPWVDWCSCTDVFIWGLQVENTPYGK